MNRKTMENGFNQFKVVISHLNDQKDLSDEKAVKTLIQEVQVDPIALNILHVDFFKVRNFRTISLIDQIITQFNTTRSN
jgi:hypothetical protein